MSTDKKHTTNHHFKTLLASPPRLARGKMTSTSTSNPTMAGYETPIRISRPAAPITEYRDPTWRTGLDATRSDDQKRADTLNHVVEKLLRLRDTTSPDNFSGLRLFIIQQGYDDIMDLMMLPTEDVKNAVVYKPKKQSPFDPDEYYDESFRKKSVTSTAGIP